jgi:PAS domain S-box-containing protein
LSNRLGVPRQGESHNPVPSFSDVLDELPLAAWLADPDGRLSYVTRGWERFFGIAGDEVLASGLTAIVHPDDLERVGAVWDAARAGGTSYRDEARVRYGDGSYGWVVSQAEPIVGPDGAIVAWFGTVTNIDGFRLTEERMARALDASAQRARAAGERARFVERLMESSDDCIVVLDLDGYLVSMSANGQRAFGIADFSSVANSNWTEFWTGDDRAAAERAVASARSGARGRFTGCYRASDRSETWWEASITPIVDAAGRPERLLGVARDVTERHVATRELARADEARERFVRLVEASNELIAFGDERGHATYVNAAGRELLGLGSPEDAREADLSQCIAPEAGDVVANEIVPALERSERWTGELMARNLRTGERIPMVSDIFLLFDERRRPIGVATVARDLRDRYRLEVALRALAEAGAVMHRSLDLETTMRNVADAVARTFASFCSVDTLGEDGRIRSIVAAPRNPESVELLVRAAAKRNRVPDHPVLRAIHHGESTLVSTIPENWRTRFELASVLRSESPLANAKSLIFVPIRSALDGNVFGALSCVLENDDPRGSYTPDDLRFAEEIAVRAALAIDHARAYEREKRIAVTLQEASLPQTLPQVAGLKLSADYRPGNDEATIGGDWYDAFVLDDGRLVITIGDVLGNGLAAAVAMGKVRQAMQSVALVFPDPATMLAAADRIIRAQADDLYATALVGIFDETLREFTFASAGHPGPSVRRPDGTIVESAAPGLILGLRAANPAETLLLTLPTPPGSTLVFYTDGLVEASRDYAEGQRRLHAAMADLAATQAGNPARALVEHALGAHPASDDIAVLVAEILT